MRNFSMPTASQIKIIPLGGVEEIGINCTVIEYKNKILVIDMGLGFPEGDMYGIDFIIPNIEYLKKNKEKIAAILITHGHLDHIGGLPYVLKDLDFPPIYGSRFTVEMITQNLGKQENVLAKAKINVVDSKSTLDFGELKANFFRVNHSIPESLGIIVRTPEGSIVHTGDFKFDNSPALEPVAEYDKIAAVGATGVLALLSDSTNSFKQGHSKSEQQISNSLQDIIEGAKGRIIIATFASLVTRIIELIEIAKRTNKKVAIAGRSMHKILEISQKMGYLGDLRQQLINTRDINHFADSKVMVIATGAQGEEMAALSRIIRDKHPDIAIKKGDTVILSASVIPGNDIYVQNLIDELSIKGAIVFHQAEDMDLHTSGHGYQEDQKIMLNLVKPKYFIPVHGFQSFLYKHAQTANSVGIKDENIIIPRRGDVISISRSGYSKGKAIRTLPVLISGSGVGDIGTIVMAERQQLGNNGVIIFSAVISKEPRKLIGHPMIQTKGFTFYKGHVEFFDNLTEIGAQVVIKALEQNVDTRNIIDQIKQKFGQLTVKEMNREPVILVMIHEV